MSVERSMTMTPAVPRPLWASRRLSKSMRTASQTDFGMSGTDEPPGMTHST